MVRTRVGYAGGTTENPTYARVGDHAETVEIDYDPSRISYGNLLDVFWAGHDPTERPWHRQYMSAIFYRNDEQKRLAERSKDREAKRIGKPIHTGILAANAFTPAEEYHQKRFLRGRPELMKEFRAFYPDPRDLVSSTAAARVNGYLGGNGTLAGLKGEIDVLGLSPAGRKTLLAIVQGYASRRDGKGTAGVACPVD